jgi:tetratricopeptide (TPR) repeat protein
MLLATPATAQLGDAIPHAPYYVALQAFYSGEYRDAERGLRRETQRGIRTTQARWIDAICYHAMLGEVLYHQGRNAEALAEFDQACQVLLAYPSWLLQVKFQQPPRPDLARTRRAPPWARSERPFTLGQFSTTEQVFVGELDPRRVLREGGVFQTPMFWRVNVAEVIRASALAIRRRGELLGPLATHDRLTKDLSDTFARGNLAQANHWSSAWIDLLRGATQASMGKLDEADMLLQRAVVVDGQFDHPLTCVALLEQGRLAMARGNSQRAAQMFAEAGISAFYYEDWDALTESALLGWVNHMSTGSADVYPPLEAISAWAQLNRLQHIATNLRLSQVESLLALGQLDSAAALLDDAVRRIGDMRRGLPGIRMLFLQAALQVARGQFGPGGETLAQAVVAQASVSLRNFQIARTGEMYDARAVSPRVAADLYDPLLSDPTSAEWLRNPLDAMAVLQTAQDAAFDRWFAAALERKDTVLALEVSEKAKRRRYLASLPLGGRLLAFRTILEAPEDTLSRPAVLERQRLFASFPAYRQLTDAAAQLHDAMRAGPVLAQDSTSAKLLAAQYDALADNAAQRQRLVMQLAVRRLPSSMEFPPLRTTAQLQQSLAEGEALAVFHAAGGGLFGFLVTRGDTHLWQLGDLRGVHANVAEFLRALGNYGPNKLLSTEDLNNPAWQKLAADSFATVFGGARLDLAKTGGLVIVPDGVLWYLPFDALVPDGANPDDTLNKVPIRYGPTAALSLGNNRPFRRPLHTGIVANELKLGERDADTAAIIAELDAEVSGPVRLSMPLPEPPELVAATLDELIVLDNIEEDRTAWVGGLPMPRAKGTAASPLDSRFALAPAGPERVIVTGFSTAAEQGLKMARRGVARNAAPGAELFHTLCGMMADHARTILLTRWRTSGRTNFDLVREFVQELPHSPATEAWRRARMLARETPLNLSLEPRLKDVEKMAEPPSADHPFFWAGYLLVDAGPRATEPNEKPAGGEQAAQNSEGPKAAMKPNGRPNEPVEQQPSIPPPMPSSTGDTPSTELDTARSSKESTVTNKD